MPDQFEALQQLALLELQRKDFASALSRLDRALALRPDARDAMCLRGKTLLGLTRFADALVAFESVLHHHPEDTRAGFGHGVALMQLGRPAEALASFDRLINIQPGHVNALINRGAILLKMGRLAEAQASFARVVELAPTSAAARNNLGAVLYQRRRYADALPEFEHALRLAPADPDALINRGRVLRILGRGGDALDGLRNATRVASARHDAWLELGITCAGEGERREALDALNQASALAPDNAVARLHALMANIPKVRGAADDLRALRDEFVRELAGFDEWIGERHVDTETLIGVAQPFCLAYQEENNRELLQRYGAILTRLAPSLPGANHASLADPHERRRLRIGIVSAQVFSHSVWHALVKGWIACLDRNRFEVCVFSLGERVDSETEWARLRADRFVEAVGDMPQWVEAIRALNPDVLIYPEIGMDAMTTRLACLRLAPVQAASWGHPETSGLSTIDYYISAAAMEPPNAQDHYSERLVMLPGLGCCLERRDIGPRKLDLAALGLDLGVPLLVCPGTPYKYAPEGDELLIAIAAKLGRCRFVFFHSPRAGLSQLLRSRLEQRFSAAGLIPSDFLAFIPWQSPEDFAGLLRQAHVYLDTAGFSGFNTALQALDAGLPVVTREGRFLRGRLAAGMLRSLGLDELVAATDEDYVNSVVHLAQDEVLRNEFRRRILSALPSLFGDVDAVKALEDFLCGAFSSVTQGAKNYTAY